MTPEATAQLMLELEVAFGRLVRQESAGSGDSSGLVHPGDPPPAVQELFLSLAAAHLRQVRDFMISLRWGEPVPGWIPICQPAIRSLTKAAQDMGLDGLSSALEAFGSVLERVGPGEDLDPSSELRTELDRAYDRIAHELPDAFSLDAEQSRRETVIVHALLQQLPEVHKLVIDKLYAAGITKVEMLAAARPEEIAQTTGISRDVAERIVCKFREYQAGAEPPDVEHSVERRALASLLARLRDVQNHYEEVSDGFSDDSVHEKRRLRNDRAALMLELRVVLARLGELDWLSDLDKLPFRAKIRSIEQYMARTAARARPNA